MRQLIFRLKNGELLKEGLHNAVSEHDIKAGVLLSVVGSLSNATLRMAGATPEDQKKMTWSEPLEIVSGTGTLSGNGCHIHIAISDQSGNVFGGHLQDGCVVKTTVEVVLGVFDDCIFDRETDPETGFKELVVK